MSVALLGSSEFIISVTIFNVVFWILNGGNGVGGGIGGDGIGGGIDGSGCGICILGGMVLLVLIPTVVK